MKTKTASRRCWHCTRAFEPNPRVRDRQVTCGAAECQRERHCDRCRAWHAANADVGRSHYQDVVVPFRERQPSYQRRWRLGRRLGEIREEMSALGSGLLASLQGLLGRADALSKSADEETQTGVLTGEVMDKARAALRRVVAAILELDDSLTQLRLLGL
jgi:hypothetical protein